MLAITHEKRFLGDVENEEKEKKNQNILELKLMIANEIETPVGRRNDKFRINSPIKEKKSFNYITVFKHAKYCQVILKILKCFCFLSYHMQCRFYFHKHNMIILRPTQQTH